MVAFDNFMVFSFERINNSKLILFQSKKKNQKLICYVQKYSKKLRISLLLFILSKLNTIKLSKATIC
jgi:hypothetical protein